jgi:2-iminobutanoate/2-iminopropanoate deaminase
MKEVIGEPLVLADGARMPLSRGVAAGGFIFVSGQLGFGPDGELVEGGVSVQTQKTLLNIEAILQQAGATLDDVVKVTGWLASETDFPLFNEVYGAFFKFSPPARSMVVSKLLIPGALVELEAVAVCKT